MEKQLEAVGVSRSREGLGAEGGIRPGPGFDRIVLSTTWLLWRDGP